MSHIILRVIAKEWVVGIVTELPEFWVKFVPWRNEVEGKFEWEFFEKFYQISRLVCQRYCNHQIYGKNFVKKWRKLVSSTNLPFFGYPKVWFWVNILIPVPLVFFRKATQQSQLSLKNKPRFQNWVKFVYYIILFGSAE